jgi:hypothetical protein
MILVKFGRKFQMKQNLYAVDWVDQNTLVFAGKDRILKAILINLVDIMNPTSNKSKKNQVNYKDNY